MLQNGEILQLCERGSHSVAKVALKVKGIYEVVNVQLTGQEYEQARNGRMKDEIVKRALTQIT